jgi:hypothetical protein
MRSTWLFLDLVLLKKWRGDDDSQVVIDVEGIGYEAVSLSRFCFLAVSAAGFKGDDVIMPLCIPDSQGG